MHALRRIRRALVPAGLLIDLHPIPPAEQAEAEGRILGRLDEREFFAIVKATEAELAKTVEERLFRLERELEADVIERFDSAEELVETVREREGTRLPRGLERRIRAATPPIDLRERIVVRRFRALEPELG